MTAAADSCGWIEWVLGSGERRTAVSQLSGEGGGGWWETRSGGSSSAAEVDLWRGSPPAEAGVNWVRILLPFPHPGKTESYRDL
jgi:hypothetical protein